jgi:hypothetical protein
MRCRRTDKKIANLGISKQGPGILSPTRMTMI